MSNLQKRIYTSLILFPLSIFFVLQGGFHLLFFLFIVFLAANYELFSVFKNKVIILFLNLVLFLALYSIVHLRNSEIGVFILTWVIILCVFSDIGGYVVGKIFKGKKLTTISPNKTLSGVLGSFIFSLFSILIMYEIVAEPLYLFLGENYLSEMILFLSVILTPKFFFLSIVFSLTAQIGDLTLSYLKRLERIKDTGKILPGHGGIFDRIDGLMFALILTFVLSKFDIFI